MTDLILPNSNNANHFRHGYKTSGKYSSEYSIWLNMRSRCNNPKNNRYYRYGARGISVCDEWNVDFVNFLNDMGRRPTPDHSIERIDNNGNYEPQNCRWATRKEQCRNRKTSKFLVFLGEEKTMAEWAEATGINPTTIHARLKAGWSVDDALSKPVKAAVSKSGKSHKPATIYTALPF